MLPKIDYCPGTLELDYDTYSPRCKAEMFGSRSKQISHILPFAPPNLDPQFEPIFQENRQRISISGVQEKYSMALVKNQLKLVNNKGQYILKPIPNDLLNRDYIPANEHITMKVAKQVFGIGTAANAMIFFSEGTPAYITRRFDYKPDGTKYNVEDFATLLGKSEEQEGAAFKYNASYEEIGLLIKRYVPSSTVAMEKYFLLVVFNYLISNGDAHLKNFSVIESPDGDYVLAPAYDMLCTRLHIDDSDLALHGGLYEGDIDSPSYQRFGVYTYDNFIELANRLSIPSSRSIKMLQHILQNISRVAPYIQRSFLSAELKVAYLKHLVEKERRLQMRGD